MVEENQFLQVYTELREESMAFMNEHHDYFNAYNKANQANLIAEKYLKDTEKIIESKVLMGVAHMDANQWEGHDMLRNLYIDNLDYLKLNDRLYLWVKTALARAKRVIGEYDESIEILKSNIDYVQKKFKFRKDNVPASYRAGVATCLYEITGCLIFKHGEEKSIADFLELEKIIENKNDQEKEDYILDLLKKDDYSVLNIAEILQEAEDYALETVTFTTKYNLKELKLVAMLNLGCLLVEQGKFTEALDKFNEIVNEEYIQKHLLGNVLDEMGLIKLKTNQLEEAKECLDKSWEWLVSKKDMKEFCRNCYIYALYHIKLGNLDMAYASAEFGYKQIGKGNIYCLRLLYLISYYKTLVAKRKGEKSEYVFYKYNLEQYKNKLKRRR
ncbi:MAG: hypothetical protein KAX49_12630 [Halanaerobiales bacterium]|nr:hypothetical protein [Halanaerobiales bacterium]